MITFQQEVNGSKGRFVILERGTPAGEMTYVWAGDTKIIIDHTETYEGFSGKGYGKQLVMEGVRFAREKEIGIMPLCPYAKKVMERDASLHDLIF